jgi:hypothetical protein
MTSTSQLFTPVVRPYSPIVSTKTLLGENVTVSSQEASPNAEGSGILPRSAASHDQQQQSSIPPRSRDPSLRRETSGGGSGSSRSHGIRTRYQSSPSSISRAILKAKEDITALTHSLRETHAEQTRMMSHSAGSRSPLTYAPPSPNGRSTPSDRIVRLLAMQQQIDVLSTSILEIQESLSGVRQGLAAALSGIPLGPCLCSPHPSLPSFPVLSNQMSSVLMNLRRKREIQQSPQSS